MLTYAGKFDVVVLATGVVPRTPAIPGIEHKKVLSYIDVLRHGAQVGKTVAIVGAGGIGFDVAEFISHDKAHAASSTSVAAFAAEWGIDLKNEARGGVDGVAPKLPTLGPCDKIYLLQRKSSKHGNDLGKTTGWIHRTVLKNKGVDMLGGVSYDKIDDKGLHITQKAKDGSTKSSVLDVDTIIICAGQEPLKELEAELSKAGIMTHLVGGADVASELDAKRAIDQATRLAVMIEDATGKVAYEPATTMTAKLMGMMGKK